MMQRIITLGLLCLYLSNFETRKSPPDYGNFIGEYYDIGKCERKDPVDPQLHNNFEYKIEVVNGKKLITGFTIIEKPYKLKKATYALDIYKNDKYVHVFNKTKLNICDDIMTFTILKDSDNVDKNCLVRAGNFSVTPNQDLNELTHKIFGRNFFYGMANLTIEYYSSRGSTMCSFVAIQIKPVKKKIKV
ncbi:uncharacterized protein LOC143919276 [Arctopsyche grandis]|uniref:uncharacterized protein LOC143919276 n=1 Tax=Arctopsyche grandis TaxID=121162 RepID=UPI00406D6ACA